MWLTLIVCCFLALFLAYYYLIVVSPVRLYCLKSSPMHNLVRKMAILNDCYWPTFWAFGQHAQILAATLMRLFVPDLDYVRQVLRLEDGGEVALDWVRNNNMDDDDYKGPIMVVLPGLTGDPQTAYVKAFVHAAIQEVDAMCVVYNYRGMAGVTLRTPRMYCATSTDDLAEVLSHVQTRFPRAPIMALGISLGGMILGNYLAEKKEAKKYLVAAMLVSTVFRPLEGLNNLERGVLNLMLNNYLTNCLKDAVRKVESSVRDHLDMERVFASSTIRELDAAFTAPLHGYEDELAYYAHADLQTRIGEIAVPTLALNAADDPLQPEIHLPRAAAEASRNFALLVTRRGSHVGFLEGLWPSNTHFSDRVLRQFVSIVFSNTPHNDNDKCNKGHFYNGEDHDLASRSNNNSTS